MKDKLRLITNTGLGFEQIEDGNSIITSFISKFPDDRLGGYRKTFDDNKFPDPFFHSNFNWLMPVLDLIERLGYDTIIIRRCEKDVVTYSCKIKLQESKSDYVSNTISDYKITAIWDAVIKFCSSYEHKTETINI